MCGTWAFFFDRFESRKKKTNFLDFIEGNRHHLSDASSTLATWRVGFGDADLVAIGQQYTGLNAPLPDPDRFQNFLSQFKAPLHIAIAIANLIKQHTSGVIHLVGEPGVGKSWACQGLEGDSMLGNAAALNEEVAILRYAITAISPPTAGDVKAALREQAKLGHRQINEPEDGTPGEMFAGWIGALHKAMNRGRLIVNIDGLDELPADSDVPLLFPRAEQMPENCFLLLSSRPEPKKAAEDGLARATGDGTRFGKITIDNKSKEHLAVLLEYARKSLRTPGPNGHPRPDEWSEQLIDKCDGSFLYLFHYCRALQFGVYDSLANLPAPSAFYPAYFDHLRSRIGDKLWESDYTRTLAFIAVAREPIGLTHLVAWGLQ